MRSPKTIRKSWFSARSKFSAAVWACLFLGAILLLGWFPGPVSHADSVPNWLAAANRVDLNHFGDGSAAVVVKQWDDFTVDASGKFVSIERKALRVLSRRAADRYLTAAGYENNDSSVSSIQAWSISPSGRIMQSSKKDVVTQAGFAEFELFSDSRAKLLRIPNPEEGALVGFEIVSQGKIPIVGKRFWLEGEIPVRQAELHVTVPSGSLRWFANHPDRMEVVNQSSNAASFRTVNRPAIPDEDDAPPFTSLATNIVVNYDPKGPTAVQSWEEAGRFYHPLFTSAEKPGTEISTQVEKLSTGKSDVVSKVDALYTYVSREIRYVAVEIGIGGYQPHPAPDVYKYKYGDCKDKATLLLTMLNDIGLRGYPALVGTRGDIEADPKVPTLATFDHMIVALPVPASLRPSVEKFPSYDPQNQILWIDPTSENDPLGQVPAMDQGVFSLISYPDHGDLQRIPETSPERNGLESKTLVHLQPGGNGTAEVELKYLGVSNSRRHSFYRGRSQSEIRRMYDERIARYVSQAAFREASIEGVEDNRKQIVEKFSFTGDFSTASSGDSWFFQPFFLTGMAVPEVGPRPRLLPLDLGTPFRQKGEYRIELPAGMRIERVPEKTSIKSEFGELQVEYSLDGNVLLATQTLSFTVSRVPPEKYPEFRDFVNASLRAERQRLRVQKIVP
jgi:Domain of Unknown Function with PDB structure (DUF3857)/Transglutaminase-like superfamily